MTDKNVESGDIYTPEKKIKAFVQHTCAMNTEQEEMGKRFAKQTFGWTRGTNPLDFIEQPLRPRSNFDDMKKNKDTENNEKINSIREKIIGKL